MTDLSLAVAQTRYSLRGFLRTPRALIFTVIMPVFLLLLFNGIFHGHTTFDGRRVLVTSYYTAAIIAYEVMLTGFNALLISVVTARQAGLLKRFRGTPMPSWVYLAAEIGRTIAVVACTVAVLVAVGVAFYHVRLSAQGLLGLVVYVVIGTACFCALGLAATRACQTVDVASAVGPFSTVILAFISGVFIPAAILPAWLLDIGKIFPLEHLVRGLQTAFLLPHSTGITASNVGVILAWGAAGLFVSVRRFEWEPLSSPSS